MQLLKTRLKNLRIKRPASIARHPREYFEEVLSTVIYQLYGLEQSFTVTRQNKPVNAGSGAAIDYAFTCFELANLVGENAPKVADKIAAQITKWLEQKHPHMASKFAVEAVNGYVNFELSDEYIAEAAYYVAHYLQKPQDRVQKNRRAHIIVEGPVLGSATEGQSINETFYFVSELYRGAGCRLRSRYIISDASEDAAKKLAEKLAHTDTYRQLKSRLAPRKYENNHVEEARFRRKVREILAGKESKSDNPEALEHIKSLRKKFLEVSEHAVSSTFLDADDVKPESKLTDKVHEWLDGLDEKHDHIIADEHSQAVYYHIKLGPLAPLRSSKGLLFKSAYLLYNFDNALRDKDKQDIVIAIVPQKYHQLLYSHADLVVPNSSYNSLICADPLLIYTELPERQKDEGPLILTSKEIAHTLAGAVSQKIHGTAKRSKLLALIDFPVELNELIMQVRLLELVSLISNDRQIAKELASKKG